MMARSVFGSVFLVLPVGQAVVVLHGAEVVPTGALGDFLHVLKLAAYMAEAPSAGTLPALTRSFGASMVSSIGVS